MADAPTTTSSGELPARQAAAAGEALFNQRRYPEALVQFRHALRFWPGQRELHYNLALVLEALEDWQAAWDAVGPAMESIALADRAAALYGRLATKLGYEVQALEKIRGALDRPASDLVCRRQLHFAAAALLDRIGRYDEAFKEAQAAHLILRPPYDATERARQFELRIAHWTSNRIQSIPRATHGNDRPVFIVGMPRSGTSLVEQILSCHPQVFGAGELLEMGRMAGQLDSTGLPYPRSLESLSPDTANRVAQSYLGSIHSLNSNARYVTDKMPLNFMYLDLIEVLLPHSHVIHCIRDPRDTCLSCYMTDFATPYDFASDPRTLAQFHRLCVQMMEHWKRVLTVPILEVSYEELVEDLEGQTRRMLQFLDLPWEERCLRFHESNREVATASREQVRRPIYKSSIGRWKNYEPYLQKLLKPDDE